MSIYRTIDQRARRLANWQIALRTGAAGLAFVSAQAAMANPSGGTVVAGSASINGEGTDRVRIDQSSDRVVINWDNFSINAGQGVDFRQPNSRAIALNRVTGPEISQIMGELTANGQVYLINGNGIVFGKDARVDVAGLVATSADITNEAFMGGGALRFGTPGRAGARVTNHGTITVRDAGIAAFVAPQVANDGIITAHMGRIAFGGAQAFTLDLHGDNLIRFQVGDAVTQIDDKGALVAIDGVVDARGGSLQITASAARDLVNQSVRIGTPQASAMQVGTDGKVSLVAAKITIGAPGEVQVGKNVAMDLSSATNAAATGARPAKGGNTTSNIGWVGSLEGDAGSAPGQAMAANGTGGTLTINAARTILDGTINLDGSKAGGTAHITGSDFLSFGSILSASGAEAGGNIQLDAGGFSLAGRITVNAGLGKGGSVDIHATRRAIDTGDAFIDASGLHGGSIRYTSDQQIISSGKFRASGSHGFGGSIDVSAPRLDLFSAQFYAQGGVRGGRVRLGGEFQGGKGLSVDELMNARTLVATDGVTIDVSAIGMRGNAGDIVVWSDEKTTFLGNAIARGGMVGGLGGQIEISGKETLVYRGTVETARDGQRGGKLLLDPKNIIIADATNSPSQYSLVLQAFASSFPGTAAPLGGLEADDNFGTSVSLDGNRLAVGAPQDDGADNLGINTGAVYLFTFEDESFAAPVLSGVVGQGYTGGKNVSVSTLGGGDQFGFAVSLADIRLAVGAPFASGNPLAGGSPDSGVVYLISFSDLAFNDGAVSGILGSGFSGPASLDVTNLEILDGFGSSVSLNGNRLAVGALADNGAGNSVMDAGAVYLFTFADAPFNAPVLEAIMGAGYTGGKNVDVTLDAGDFFGTAVSLSGFGLAVGAPGDDGQGGGTFDYGAAYLYSFSSFDFSDATLESTLGVEYFGPNDVALGLEANDRFGASLGLIGGASFAVLADGDDGLADTATDSGAAYLFTFTAPFFQGPLLAGIIGADYGSLGGRNLSVAGLGAGDTLSSLTIGFNTLALGVSNDGGRNDAALDSGAVYLFTFGDDAFNNGRQIATLGAGYAGFSGLSLVGTGLNELDSFGASVSLNANRLAVGVPGDDGFGNERLDAGAVYLFTFGDSRFSAPVLQAIIGAGYTGGNNLSVARLETGDRFGSAVSLDGLRLAVGAPGDDGANNGGFNSGAVYQFFFNTLGFFDGSLEGILSAESFAPGIISSENARFGSAVSLSGNVIAVGAIGDPGGDPMVSLNDVGAVHIIDIGGTTPALLATIGKGYEGISNVDIATLEENDMFGSAVALDGLRLTVGAPGDDGVVGGSIDAGAVYLLTFADSSFTGGTNVGIIGAGYEGASGFTAMGLGAGDNFGSAVSLKGLQLIVGAPGDDGLADTVTDAGAVYLFNFDDDVFSGPLQSGIVGADYAGEAGFSVKLESADAFGSAVALDSDRMVVGSTGNSGRNDRAAGSGATYLFTFGSANFSETRLIDTLGFGYSGSGNFDVPGLGDTTGMTGLQFGASVALQGLRLAVGVPGDPGAAVSGFDLGAVYLFSFADLAFGAPVLEAIVGDGYSGGKNISVPLVDGGRFGAAVALDGNRLAVGVPGDRGNGDPPGFQVGSVFLFTFSDLQFAGGALAGKIGDGFTGPQSLAVVGLENFDRFGTSVALRGNALVVGAPGDDGQGNGLTDSGAVYLFSFTDAAFNGGVREGYIAAGANIGGKDIDLAQLGSGDQFGTSVALSPSGTRLFVGAPGDAGSSDLDPDAGAVYEFAFSSSAFDSGTLLGTFGLGYSGFSDLNVPGLVAGDRFGSSVAVDGNLQAKLAVGAPGDSGAPDTLPASGQVYLFDQFSTSFSLIGVIGAGYGGNNNVPIGSLDSGDLFGSSVTIDLGRLVVGAPGDEGFADTGLEVGATYLFTLSNELLGPPVLAGTMGAGYGAQKNVGVLGSFADNLGAAAALRGNQLAIGVPGARQAGGGEVSLGAVYLFTFADAGFSAPTLTGIIGQGYTGAGSFNIGVLDNNDNFGASVSLDGLRLAVGAPGDDGAGNALANSGAVYLFTFADTGFASPALAARLGFGYTGGNDVDLALLEADDQFGASVSLAGTQLAVGAIGDDGADDLSSNVGAVHLLSFANSAFVGGQLEATIGAGYLGLDLAALGAIQPFDRFGSAVSLSGLGLAVGAPGDDGFFNNATDAGAVYLINFSDGAFSDLALSSTFGRDYTEINDLNLTDVSAGDELGSAVSLDGTSLAVGSRGDRGQANDRPQSGAVYLFSFFDTAFSSPILNTTIGAGYAQFGGDLSVNGLASGDMFGSSVAIDQGRLVVGASGDDGPLDGVGNAGALYLFRYADGFSGLSQIGVIGAGYANGPTQSLAALGMDPSELFGNAVALDGLRLAVGAPQDSGASDNAQLSGAVYLITFADLAFGAPVLQAIVGSGYSGGKNVSVANLEAGDRFGFSVALGAGGLLAVGADGDSGFGNTNLESGAAYLFSFSDALFSGLELKSIIGRGYTGPGNFDIALGDSDRFGSAIGISGADLAIGAPGDDGFGDPSGLEQSGAVHLFQYDAGMSAVTLVGTIGAGYTGGSSIDFAPIEFDDLFGSSLSLNQGRLVVGAPHDSGAGNIGGISSAVGAVYTFTFAGSGFTGGTHVSTIGLGYSGANDFDVTALAPADRFGFGVSLDGSRLAIGSIQDNGANNDRTAVGAVYLFSFADAAFAAPVQEAIIGADYIGGKNIAVPLDDIDIFGVSVALDGNRLVVGAQLEDGANNAFLTPGGVYLFTFADAAFNGGALVGQIGAGYRSTVGLDLTTQAAISSVQVGGGDGFGAAVSLDGNRLAIGAPGDDGVSDGLGNAGAVYLFTFADGGFGGAQLQGIIGHGYVGGKNLWPMAVEADDNFGAAVSLDGNRLAVGAPGDDGTSNTQGNAGAVYLFSFADGLFGGGVLEAVLGIDYGGGKNLSIAGLEAGDQFGWSLSLDGTRLAVGAPGDDGVGNGLADSGAVHLLSFTDPQFAGGLKEGTLGSGYIGTKDLNIVLGDTDQFGFAVALDGTRLAVGAPGDDASGDGLTDAGAAYLFTFADTAFNTAIQRGIVGVGYAGAGDVNTVLTPFGFASGSLFGSSIALDGLRLAIGGPLINIGVTSPSQSGAVYLFTFADTLFGGGTIADILAKGALGFGANLDLDLDLETSDFFGTAVSLDGNRLVVGASGDDGFGNGAASLDSGAVYTFTFADAEFNAATLPGTIGAGYTRGLSTPVAGVEADDRFGSAVSLDGLRLAVGAGLDGGFGNSAPGAGAVYLFTFADVDFAAPVLQGILGVGYSGGKNLAVSGLNADSLFGNAVSLDGNRLAVGSPFDSGSGGSAFRSGAVYLFGFSDAAFSNPDQLAVIGNGYSGGSNFDLALSSGANFGSAVSLSGNYLAVGSPNDAGFGGSVTAAGAVYLFGFADDQFNSPALIGTLGSGYTNTGDINLASSLDAGDQFGSSVALSGNRLAVGAALDDGFGNAVLESGAVYLFTFASSDLSGGALAGTIGDGYSGANSLNLAGLSTFGGAVALDGSRLAVGTLSSSIAYVLSFADSNFATPTLDFRAGANVFDPNDIAVADTFDTDFGLALSLDEGRLVVGAPRSSGPDGLLSNSGAVYFFSLGGGALPGLAFGDNPGADVTISASALAAILSGGTAVELQANNDITVNNAIAVSAGGNGGNLTFRAGRSILVNAGITTDGGNFTAIANEFASGGVVDAFRDPGDAVITFGAGGLINTGTGSASLRILAGDDKTFSSSGAISVGSITASSIVVQNLGMSGNRAVNLNAGALLTASGAGDAIVIESDVFTNSAGAGVFNLTGGGRFLVYSTDYEVIDRGGLVGNNLYNGVSPGGFAGNLFIFARQPVLTFTADDATRTYGQGSPAYTFQVVGLVNGDSESYAYSGIPNLFDLASGNAGVDSIFIDQGSLISDVGYGFDFVGAALTTLRALLTVRADDQTRVYGDSNPLFTVTYTGFVNGDDESAILFTPIVGTFADETSDVGSYAITLSEAFAENYEFDYVPGTLTITRALLTVTADNASRVYGDANPAFTGSITGFRNSDTASVISGLVYGSVATSASDAGTYAITGSGASATNYDFAYVPGTLTITRALLTVTAADATREYGLADPVFTGSISGLRNGDDASVISGLVYGSSAVLSSGIGTYSITGSGATSTNYDFAYVPGTLTITRALLTVTADNATREYGLANPVLTGTISGLRAGDTASVVSGLVYNTLANIGSDVGAYTILASGGSAANYDFAYAPGTLTITRALLTVTADGASRVYGDANPVFTGSITGFRNSDTASVISGLVYGSVATSASDAGTYAITGSGGSAANYDFAYAPGTLTITRALLTVTADNATREYGLANPALTSTITGLRNGDTAAVVSGLVLGTSATQASGVGNYGIGVSGGSALNYDFNYVPGTLVITPATLTVAIDNKTRVYGSANPDLTASITGFRNGEDQSVVAGLRLRTGAIARTNVGSYLITGSGANAANYRFDYVPGTMTITKALLQVRVNNASREYGLANPEFTARITGFRNGDNASVISGLTFGTPALIGSDVGNYAITASGASALNYDFSYVPGRLTINQARLLITANSMTMTEGGGNPVLTVSFEGLRNGDSPDVVTGLVLRASGGGSVGPGQYIINASRGTARNYQITYRPGVMTVLPAVPPAQDPPATGGSANPPVFTFVPPAGGIAAPVASPPENAATVPPAQPAPPPVTALPTGDTAAPVASMPVQGAVSVPVPPTSLSPMQVLQGLSAPLPVLVAPESRPDDAEDVRNPSQGNGQRTGCAYISLCTGVPVPLWTYQPAQ